MNALGEKIKARRKQLGLTLKQLAGNDFSYSLLSQIENNKANPSMDTLQKLAQKLDMPISELLNNQSYIDYKSLLKKCEKLFVMDYEWDLDRYEQIKTQIEEVLEDLTFQQYEEVRLVEIYCNCKYQLDNELPNDLFTQVTHFYEEIGNYNKFLQAKLFLIGTLFNQQKYEQCQEHLEQLAVFFEENRHLIDTSVLLDYFHMQALIFSATGDYDHAVQSLEYGISLAKQHSLYKKHVRYLQLSCFVYSQLHDEKKVFETLTKFKYYTEFSENLYEIGFYDYANFFVQNRFSKHSITESLVLYIDDAKKLSNYTISPIFTQELAYSYWKTNDYVKVIETLEHYSIPNHITHPLDVAGCLEMLAIRAYCYNEIGKREQAIEEIIDTYQRIKHFPNSTFKHSIEHIYKKLLLL